MVEIKLTTRDTKALWYAISWMDLCLQVSPSEGTTVEAIEAEKTRLTEAKRALRKVNAIRKAQSASTGEADRLAARKEE